MFSFLYHRQDFCQTRLHIWASQRVSYKMQKVRTIREHLDSLMGFGGVHIAHNFGFVYCVELCCVFLCFVLVCLRLRVILHQFWVKKFSPQNSIWNTAVSLRSYSSMFQVEICSQQLEICKSVCMFIVLAIVVETD